MAFPKPSSCGKNPFGIDFTGQSSFHKSGFQNGSSTGSMLAQGANLRLAPVADL
jgi:hypothetical protein